jgi:uncharacterized protein (DUF885 family)
MRRHLLALSIALALSACGGNPPPETTASTPAPAATPAAAAQKSAAEQLNALYDEYWEESLKLNPVQATFVGDNRYNDQLPNFLGKEYRDQALAFAHRYLERAKAFDPAQLQGQDRLSYDIFVRERALEIEGARFPGWLVPINQFYNLATFPIMLGSGTNAQPFKTVEDYDMWLARMTKFPVVFDQAIANMRDGMKAGVVQPKVLMTKVLPQIEAQLVANVEDSILYNPIKNFPAEFTQADKDRLTAAYAAAIKEQMLPAFRRLHDFIAKEYLPACRDTVGLSALPDGEAWYAFNVKTQTTTDLTPAQIHEIGLAEVARIHGEMRKVMGQVGFEGELKDFFKHLTTDKRFKFASEADMLKAYNDLSAKLRAATPSMFSLTPKAGFEIRPVEAYRAQSAAGGSYQSPSEDGSRPGIFYLNTFDLPSRATWDMESLFLHEAIPGHHFQIALQQELAGLPKFRRFGGETAFAEGWGLYAESLGKELGVYSDPYQYFGALQAELWRAIRLVVDTGLHSKGWTREQVIAYMLENSATTNTEAVAETERYIAIPGQALAYKIGALKIRELRTRAEQALADKFDVKAFHAQVLEDGALPLGVLEAKIDRWIAEEKGSAVAGASLD